MFRIVGEHAHGSCRVAEVIVGDIGLHAGAVREARVQHGVHGTLGDIGDGLALQFICLAHNGAQPPGLVDDHHRVGRHHQQNGDEHKIENLLLNTANDKVSDFFHFA